MSISYAVITRKSRYNLAYPHEDTSRGTLACSRLEKPGANRPKAPKMKNLRATTANSRRCIQLMMFAFLAVVPAHSAKYKVTGHSGRSYILQWKKCGNKHSKEDVKQHATKTDCCIDLIATEDKKRGLGAWIMKEAPWRMYHISDLRNDTLYTKLGVPGTKKYSRIPTEDALQICKMVEWNTKETQKRYTFKEGKAAMERMVAEGKMMSEAIERKREATKLKQEQNAERIRIRTERKASDDRRKAADARRRQAAANTFAKAEKLSVENWNKLVARREKEKAKQKAALEALDVKYAKIKKQKQEKHEKIMETTLTSVLHQRKKILKDLTKQRLDREKEEPKDNETLDCTFYDDGLRRRLIQSDHGAK